MTSKSTLKTIQSTHEFFSNQAWINENCPSEIAELLIKHGSAIQGHIIAFMCQDPKKRNAIVQPSNQLTKAKQEKSIKETATINPNMELRRSLSQGMNPRDNTLIRPLSPWASLSNDIESQIPEKTIAVEHFTQTVSDGIFTSKAETIDQKPSETLKRSRGRPRSGERPPIGLIEINRLTETEDGVSHREKVMVNVYKALNGTFYYKTDKGNHIKITNEERIRRPTLVQLEETPTHQELRV